MKLPLVTVLSARNIGECENGNMYLLSKIRGVVLSLRSRSRSRGQSNQESTWLSNEAND
jgi:hypothetical protein